MPLYTARAEGGRIYSVPVKYVPEDLKPVKRPLKVLVIKGYPYSGNQQVDKLLDSLGHHYDGLGDWVPGVLEELKSGRFSRVIINTNTISSEDEAKLFYAIEGLKRTPKNLPTIIAYTEGKPSHSLQAAAVEGGPIDVIVSPSFGGLGSVSNYPSKEDLQAALKWSPV